MVVFILQKVVPATTLLCFFNLTKKLEQYFWKNIAVELILNTVTTANPFHLNVITMEADILVISWNCTNKSIFIFVNTPFNQLNPAQYSHVYIQSQSERGQYMHVGKSGVSYLRNEQK